MQRHKFARAFKFTSIITLMFITVLLTGTLYAAPKVGPVTPGNSIIGQNANDYFGSGDEVHTLPNGNIVIANPYWNSHRGAVTCLTPNEYKTGGIMISAANSLVGANIGDQVGLGRIVVLSNGNYVVSSPEWNNKIGAATWVNGATCFSYGESSRGAVVSAANSLIGSNSGQSWGTGITALNNGNYVVLFPYWDNGTTPDVGAVTWVNGLTGTAGTISATNSLIGSNTGDHVGGGGVAALSNGHYVVASPAWDKDTIPNVGAATWGNGTIGLVGFVSPANSLIGVQENDLVGQAGVTALTNGNYVVGSPWWNNSAGAATWVDGSTITTGVVGAANSLIGSDEYSMVSSWGITALTNGNYVVSSPNWTNGNALYLGAVTWGDGTNGAIGVVSASNSLVGSTEGDYIGIGGITALNNGNYVVSSGLWNNHAGAVTWGNGTSGIIGEITPGNSLVGSQFGDSVGGGSDPTAPYGITALSNGNYVVSSPGWNYSTGAATWGNGEGGTVGMVDSTNSLVGSHTFDEVSSGKITPLTNGSYVVSSPGWNNAAGAATWGNGEGGTVGVVSAANSLVGTQDDFVSLDGIIPLTNGHYVVMSIFWDNGVMADAGAITWGNGSIGTVGIVGEHNSLVGANSDPSTSVYAAALSNGNYAVSSPSWDKGAITNAGAVFVGDGVSGSIGTFSAVNSLTGSTFADAVGEGWLYALPDGSFIVSSPNWDNGAIQNVGAITWSDGTPLPPNSAPILADVGNQTVDEGDTLTFDANASDVDAPPQTLTFSITGAPEDASFNTSTGEFSWMPDEADGGQTFNVTVTVTDNGEPALSDSEAFTITVNEVNNAPVLAEIGNQTVDVGATLTFDAEATDSDEPAQTLTFSITGAPEGASFNTATGEFSWTSDEADGGQVFNVTVTVTDDGAPALSDSEAFTIAVNEVNNVPVLAEIGNQTVDVGATLTFDADATDADEPAQTLTFSIDGAPEDASFDTATGEFSWTAGEDDDGQVFNVTVTVTDDGEPAESDSETFIITVNPVVVVETNYLPNPSFENAGTTNKTAAGWNGIGLTTNDKRICDTETKTYAHDGECAFRFQFNGASSPARTLQRNLNVKNFAKNEVMELRGMVKANGLTAGARLIVKVVYNNGKTEAVSVKLLPGNYDYALRTVQITLKRPVKKITVQIKAGSAKGVFFVDDMAVVKVAAPLTIDDGAIDSGLRGLR